MLLGVFVYVFCLSVKARQYLPLVCLFFYLLFYALQQIHVQSGEKTKLTEQEENNTDKKHTGETALQGKK